VAGLVLADTACGSRTFLIYGDAVNPVLWISELAIDSIMYGTEVIPGSSLTSASV
jgi:hypothetical protein